MREARKVRNMKRVLLLLVLSTSLGGCGSLRQQTVMPSPIATALTPSPTFPLSTPALVISPVATLTPAPAPTPAPVAAWPALPPPTGVTHIDAIVRLIVMHDVDGLTPHVTGFLKRCSESNHPFCPEGTPEYTMVRAVASTVCDGEAVRLDDTLGPSSGTALTRLRFAQIIVNRGDRIVAVWRSRPGSADLRYSILVTKGSAWSSEGILVGVDDEGIVSEQSFPACGLRGAAFVDARSQSYDVLIAPP